MMARRGVLLLLLAWCALARASPGGGWEVSNVPNPVHAAAACGRAHAERSWVCDPDKLLSRPAGDAIEATLAAIHRAAPAGSAPASAGNVDGTRASASHVVYPRTTCHAAKTRGYEVRVEFRVDVCYVHALSARCGRAQVAVVVVGHAGGTGSAASRAERLAKGLHDAWGVGDACGSGILLLVAVEDRQARARVASGCTGHLRAKPPATRGTHCTCAPTQAFISTGASASAAASDVALELVLDRMRPLLRAGDLDAALQGAVRDIGDVLAGKLLPTDPLLSWALILCAIGSVFVWNRWAEARRARRYREVTRNLSKLEGDVARAKAARYAATSCPICMEDFEPDDGFPGADGAPAAPLPPPRAASDKKDDDATAPSGSGTSDASGSRPSAPPAGSGLKKSLLPCGHAFCEPCLRSALAVKLACPICRAPPDGTDAPPRPPPPPPCNGGGGAAAAGADFDTYLPELAFRLRRLHMAHPDYVTENMVDRWTSRTHAGTFTNDPALLRANPARTPSGSGGSGLPGGGAHHGSSSSFGGGSSSGGGGRGGGW